jgi:glycosyltransferase involved in cell wall biosynthesis
MKVSVVIPAYNEENWVGKTLEAVLKVDYPDFEVIVVDNASIDKTSEVVETYVKKDPRVKLVHQPKKGLLNAREAGRLEATGDIIAQLDADCLPAPDWISKAVKYFDDENIVGVSGPYRLYDATPAMRTESDLLAYECFPKPARKTCNYCRWKFFYTSKYA